jgi:exonuclease SbcD
MAIRFAHIADIHLGSYQGKLEAGGLNSRFVDFVKTFNESVDKMIAEKIDFCVMAGDIFRSKTPTPEELNEFAKGVLRLLAEKISVVVVLGNHDLFLADNRTHSIGVIETLLSSHENFYISKAPEIIRLSGIKGREMAGIQIQTMPYPVRSILKLANNEEVIKYVEDKTAELHDKLDDFYPAIYVGHYTLRDAVVGDERRFIDKFAEPVINNSIFDGKKYSYVAMGHIHKYQVVSENPPVVYCGSNNRIDFNEAKEDKGFVLVDIDDKNRATYKFIKVGARKFIDLKYELEDSDSPTEFILNDFEKRKDEISNAIVRINVIISDKNENKYSLKSVSDFLEKYAYWVHGNCLPTIVKEGRARQDAGFNESMDVFSALRHYAKVNKIKNDSLFVLLGESIIRETRREEEES